MKILIYFDVVSCHWVCGLDVWKGLFTNYSV